MDCFTLSQSEAWLTAFAPHRGGLLHCHTIGGLAHSLCPTQGWTASVSQSEAWLTAFAPHRGGLLHCHTIGGLAHSLCPTQGWTASLSHNRRPGSQPLPHTGVDCFTVTQSEAWLTAFAPHRGGLLHCHTIGGLALSLCPTQEWTASLSHNRRPGSQPLPHTGVDCFTVSQSEAWLIAFAPHRGGLLHCLSI